MSWRGVAWRAGVMRVRYPHTRGEKEKEGGGGCLAPGEVGSSTVYRGPATRISWIHEPRRSPLVCRVPPSVVSADVSVWIPPSGKLEVPCVQLRKALSLSLSLSFLYLLLFRHASYTLQ